MSLLSSPNATATVAQNTSAVTIAGMDLAGVQPSMLLHLGARDRKKGDGLIIASVAPNVGSTGGTLTLVGPVDAAFTNAAFLIDTGSYNGAGEVLKVDAAYEVLNALRSLTSPNTNVYGGDRIVALDKKLATNVSYLALSIGGRSWGRLEQRTLSYTPTGGSQVSTEAASLRALPDGTTPIDAVLVDLATGGVDVRKASIPMVSAALLDLSSAPMAKVAVTGSAAITSFGPGKHLERLVRFVDGGNVLTHNATSLILPGGANIVTRPGDCLHATSDVAGNWRVHSYDRADGTPLILPISTQRAAFRNRIRNGGFTINERGVSGTVTLAAGVYGHDGFKAGAGGCTYAFSKNNGVTTFNITAGTLLQVIEGALYVVEGGTYTASWIGTAQARVYQGGATGSYASGPLTVLGLGSESNTTVEWGIGTLALPQFEPGAIATTFERRDDEAFRNLRYQQPVPQMDGIFINSTLWYGIVKTSPTMAFTPSLVLKNGANALNEYQNATIRNATSFANPLYVNTGGDLFLNTSTANSGARASLSGLAAVMRSEY
ncbi:hypothetical protein [Methylobacterium sp. WL9]|uniref:hypothetical protein n=1 Tax=Methylobacterium sp. WL9 TaxID=2603898 RepID=UPI0011C90E52|nr:hypothetical protein [Methylobacterium sp. WL9]TXN23982.1 hypothetical protein FV217_04765 [Methylobacterium sp. WL9]